MHVAFTLPRQFVMMRGVVIYLYLALSGIVMLLQELLSAFDQKIKFGFKEIVRVARTTY